MPKYQREQYDAPAICRFMGKMMFALALSGVFWLLSDVLNKTWLGVLGIILFIAIIVFILVYMNTGNRFRK